MSRRLPDRPDLDHVRREAKALLQAHRAKEARATEVLRHIARLKDLPDDEIAAASVSLQEAQHALAREYGFQSWKALKDKVEARVAPTTEDLIARLRSKRIRTRMTALRQLAIRIHPDWTTGTPFGWGLAKPAQSAPDGIEPIVDRLAKDASWRIRREAVSALAAYAHLGIDQVEEALRRALNDPRHAVQHAAARALGTACSGCGETPSLAEYVPS